MELDKIQREMFKYKQDSHLLQNFDEEFIRLSKHRDVLDEKVSELKRSHQNEVREMREEFENEIKDLIYRIENDKQSEFESIIENLKNNIKHLETVNAELKEKLNDKDEYYKEEIEKEINISLKRHQDSLENEFRKRLDQLENDKNEDIAKLNSKFEKNLMEEYRKIEKLEKQKKNGVIII